MDVLASLEYSMSKILQEELISSDGGAFVHERIVDGETPLLFFSKNCGVVCPKCYEKKEWNMSCNSGAEISLQINKFLSEHACIIQPLSNTATKILENLETQNISPPPIDSLFASLIIPLAQSTDLPFKNVYSNLLGIGFTGNEASPEVAPSVELNSPLDVEEPLHNLVPIDDALVSDIEEIAQNVMENSLHSGYSDSDYSSGSDGGHTPPCALSAMPRQFVTPLANRHRSSLENDAFSSPPPSNRPEEHNTTPKILCTPRPSIPNHSFRKTSPVSLALNQDTHIYDTPCLQNKTLSRSDTSNNNASVKADVCDKDSKEDSPSNNVRNVYYDILGVWKGDEGADKVEKCVASPKEFILDTDDFLMQKSSLKELTEWGMTSTSKLLKSVTKSAKKMDRRARYGDDNGIQVPFTSETFATPLPPPSLEWNHSPRISPNRNSLSPFLLSSNKAGQISKDLPSESAKLPSYPIQSGNNEAYLGSLGVPNNDTVRVARAGQRAPVPRNGGYTASTNRTLPSSSSTPFTRGAGTMVSMTPSGPLQSQLFQEGKAIPKAKAMVKKSAADATKANPARIGATEINSRSTRTLSRLGTPFATPGKDMGKRAATPLKPPPIAPPSLQPTILSATPVGPAIVRKQSLLERYASELCNENSLRKNPSALVRSYSNSVLPIQNLKEEVKMSFDRIIERSKDWKAECSDAQSQDTFVVENMDPVDSEEDSLRSPSESPVLHGKQKDVGDMEEINLAILNHHLSPLTVPEGRGWVYKRGRDEVSAQMAASLLSAKFEEDEVEGYTDDLQVEIVYSKAREKKPSCLRSTGAETKDRRVAFTEEDVWREADPEWSSHFEELYGIPLEKYYQVIDMKRRYGSLYSSTGGKKKDEEKSNLIETEETMTSSETVTPEDSGMKQEWNERRVDTPMVDRRKLGEGARLASRSVMDVTPAKKVANGVVEERKKIPPGRTLLRSGLDGAKSNSAKMWK